MIARLTKLAMPLAICAIVLPIVVAFVVMITHWVLVPYWDEWKTPGEQLASYYRGTLTLQELCSQHNESRKLFPRLVYLPLAIATHWDVRWLMALSFAFVCAGSALLYQVARRSCDSQLAAICCFAAMNVWLFWPRQYENFLLGIQGELFTPAFAIAAACLINLSARPLWLKTLANAALALISTYTVANGMLVWLLAFPVQMAAKRATNNTNRWSQIMYLAAAVASIACYFHGYHHPESSPPFVFSVQRWPELAQFVAVWLGDITLLCSPMVAGAVAALLFAVLAAFALCFCSADRGWQRHYPWLLLGSYTLVSGSITAAGRLGFGLNSAAHFRYAPFTAFLYIAIAGLAASIYDRLDRREIGARGWRIGCAIAGVCVIALALFAYQRERPITAETKAHRQRLLLAMRWSLAIPQNPDLALMSPYETTLATIRTLAEHDALRPRLVSAEVAALVAHPPSSSDDAAGALEGVTRGATANAMKISGWAAANYVVIGYDTGDGSWKPLTVAPTNLKRRDGAARSGFDHTIYSADLPSGVNTFRAWAIDENGKRALPLAGAIRFPAATP